MRRLRRAFGRLRRTEPFNYLRETVAIPAMAVFLMALASQHCSIFRKMSLLTLKPIFSWANPTASGGFGPMVGSAHTPVAGYLVIKMGLVLWRGLTMQPGYVWMRREIFI